jgi:beta-glucosidase-like glycosyl hydrolase
MAQMTQMTQMTQMGRRWAADGPQMTQMAQMMGRRSQMGAMSKARVRAVVLATAGLWLALPSAQAPLDREAERWVARTMAKLSVDDRIGQLIAPAFDSTYLPTDSDEFDRLTRVMQESHAGAVIAFGGTEPAPQVLLNPAYGSVVLGHPLALASTLNRLQAAAPLPLLATADFEYGAGMRIAGATRLPRAMALGAAGDPQLAFEAGRITAAEGRAMGVHVNFAPVADVNNNPRNPVINTRSFGENPARVGELVAAYVRGLQQGGMIATIKHFPGHGDTETDSHLGLPLIAHPRDRLQALELPPFKAGLAAGAGAVMVAHIELPALDAEKTPATFSRPIVTDLLRRELAFGGLIVTDAMKMDAITRMVPPGEAAVRAVQAGADLVLDSPDPVAAFTALKAAVASGQIERAQVDASVARVLRAKARLGLHRTRAVSMDTVAQTVGGRQHQSVARTISERSVTLVKDEGNRVPLRLPPTSSVLYLSVLDYPSGWRIAAPSRTIIPELKKRWAATDAVEVSDRSTPNELDLVRAMASKYDAVVAGVFVRVSSGSGRQDLAAPVVRLLQDLARGAERRGQPMVAAFFGSPYAAASVPELRAMILTYDLSDLAEASAVRALAGEIPIGGRLPITIPGVFQAGHGLTR